MTCLPSTEKTRASTASSPAVTCARMTTRMFAPTERQSSKFGLSGLSGGRPARRLSGKNWKRPSDFRLVGGPGGSGRQAARLAPSPARGMPSGTANRWPPVVMMILLVWGGAWAKRRGAPHPAARITPTASLTLRCGLEEGLDGDFVGAIGLGKRAKGLRRVDGPQGGVVEKLYPAALHGADRTVLQSAVGEDGEGDRDWLTEAALHLPGPDQPDLLLHGGEVPVTGRVAPVRRPRTGRADDAHASRRHACARAPDGRLGRRALHRRRTGIARGRRGLLRPGLRPLGVGRRQSLPWLFLRRLDDLRPGSWRRLLGSRSRVRRQGRGPRRHWIRHIPTPPTPLARTASPQHHSALPSPWHGH